MLTAAERERRAIMVANGLEHYGECRCGVGSRGVDARLYRCQSCGVKSCYRCRDKRECCAIYRDYYTDVVQLLTVGGYEFQAMGGLLSQPALNAMADAVTRGEGHRDFAKWLLREQRRAQPIRPDENNAIGEETISPNEAAA